MYASLYLGELTHWDQDKVDDCLICIFLNDNFRIFYLTIRQHWFDYGSEPNKWHAIIRANDSMGYRRIYTSLGLNDLTNGLEKTLRKKANWSPNIHPLAYPIVAQV